MQLNKQFIKYLMHFNVGINGHNKFKTYDDFIFP